MGAATSVKDSSIISSLKSQKAQRKSLRNNSSKDARVTNEYSELPNQSSRYTSCESKSIPVSGTNATGTKIKYDTKLNGTKDTTDHSKVGIQPYVPTRIPTNLNNNSKRVSIKSDSISSQNGHLPVNSKKSTGDLRRPSLTSKSSRVRSVSPRRHLERALSQGTISRSELEHIKSAMRSCRSASMSSHRKRPSRSRSISHELASAHPDKMTSFVVGNPPKFTSGAFGNLGTFKSISPVNESLYICGVMAMSEQKLKALKINCVINATLEWPPYQIPGLETVRVQVDDVPSSNLAPYFDKIADKMNEVIRRGGKVLVHCMAGISRSSTLCIAYLMKYKGLSLPQAYSLMKTRRPLVRPNDGFWRQLTQYEKELKRRKALKSSTVSKELQSSFSQIDLNGKEAGNPSMTVTRLSSGRVSHPLHATKAGNSGTRSRRSIPSLRSLPNPSGSAGVARDGSPHKLGTLRHSGRVEDTGFQPSRQALAFSTMRRGDHWSTTYNSDYSLFKRH